MTVFRLHIRPKGGLGQPKYSFEYCLNEQVLGLGWQVGEDKTGISWDDYEEDAIDIYGSKELSRVRYLKNNVKTDDLIWTRDTDGNYYLAKSQSGWEYHSTPNGRKADIINLVRCDIRKVISIDDVPGKVIACFRPSRTIQSIRDETASDYSKYLWNKLAENDYFDVEKSKFKNVFSFLDSDEIEDVIFIYLQTQNWIVVPNSRKSDTMNYEFYLINRDTKERAVVQVKSGETVLHTNYCGDKKEKVFLFQANNRYKGSALENVTCLVPKDIEIFMCKNKDLLPANIIHWLNVASSNN